jgi:hypothetical protein
MRYFLLITSLFLYSISVDASTTVAECDSLLPEIVFESNDFSITINVVPNTLVDQYKFRYKEVGASFWAGVVVIGAVDSQPQSLSFKSVTNLLSCNQYQFQKRILATDGCDSGWIDAGNAFTSTTSLVAISGCDSVQISENGPYYFETDFYSETVTSSNGCDSIILADITINSSFNADTAFVSSCDLYMWNQIIYNESGVYQQVLTTSQGCDSTLVLELTINGSEIGTDTQVHCDSYEWQNGVTYTSSNNDAISFLQNTQGCDSIVELDLTIYNSSNTIFNESVCNADSFSWNDSIFTQSGQYVYNYTNLNGCDSSMTLNLSLVNYPELDLSSNNYSITVTVDPNPLIDQYKFRYRQLGSFSWIAVGVIGAIDGVGQSNSSKTFTNGILECTTYEIQSRVYSNDDCDSGWNPEVQSVTTSSVSSETLTVCDSVQFAANSPYYSTSGTYEESFTSSSGCDSIIIYNLTVLQSSLGDTLELSTCDNFNWNDKDYSSSGFYTDTLVNVQLCDSIVFLQLEILSSSFYVDSQQHCDSFEWQDGNVYTESINTAAFVLQNSVNCDSVVTLDLSILNSTSSLESILICESSYLWNDSLYTENGSYQFIATNSNGCDSIANLNLLLSTTSIVTESVDACNNYSWNGTDYTTSGLYEFVSTNAAGCDSLSYLDLSMGFSSETSQTVSSCGMYNVSYPLVGGEFIEFNVSESTSFSYTILNSQLCDSTINLEIIISDSVYQSNIQIEQCGSFTWNDEVYTDSGVYSFETTSSSGCDSIAVLELTILPVSNSVDSQSHCVSFTWIDDITYTESTDSPFVIYQNSLGCDSIVSLSLTILAINNSTETLVVCDQFEWNGSTYSNTGQYNFNTTGSLGCDSSAILNLTVAQLANLNVNGSVQENVGSSSTYSVSNNSNSSYQWQLGSLGTISNGQGTNSVNIAWSQEGTASICVTETDQNGCQGQQSCIDISISTVASIDETNSLLSAIVYPNPFRQELNIDFFTPAKNKRQIMLFDLQGRLVYSTESLSDKIVIKRAQLKLGSYLLKVISEKGSINKSVILN